MKTILDVQNDVEFLGVIYKAIDQISNLVEKVGINEIRSRLPEISAVDTSTTREEKLREQSKKNMMDMAKGFLCDYPEDTVALLHSLIILEDGEEYPQGFELLAVALKCICDNRIIDFFQSLARLNAIN